jgi:Ca2+-transporting ATPase
MGLYRGQGEQDARAISFTTLVLGNLVLIWANRSLTRTIPKCYVRQISSVGDNGGRLSFLGIVLYVPAARELFQFSVLHVNDLAVAQPLPCLA